MANSPGTEATGLRSSDARGDWLTTNRDAAKILDTYIEKAKELFIRRAQDAGLNLTGELLHSFRTFAAQEAGSYVEARLTMSPLARIKDLQSLNYARTPPLSAMVRMVENNLAKYGRAHFYKGVPGYPKGVWPASETQAIERIAWGYKMALQRFPNVIRGYRGMYSDPLLKDVLPYLFRDLVEAAGHTAMKGMKLAFEFN
ncbi:hypothetical protein [Spirosoma oryzicola]|uniref:hypothetical protein n=1 Tax=Spirosoma oryzicola TaxID=2898794 RepID=UPI001E624070|nr:hypothetical protein [Spirosoma oryzicola]UHG93383.1 hypothetical protein LQ777_10870 [Spirosoma oryzicola]